MAIYMNSFFFGCPDSWVKAKLMQMHSKQTKQTEMFLDQKKAEANISSKAAAGQNEIAEEMSVLCSSYSSNPA